MGFMDTLRRQAKTLKAEALTLYCALKHPQTPRAARWLALLVVAYALSPIDLIPDFIPILGLLDDLILLPLGIALVIRLIPPEVLAACRQEASQMNWRSLSRSKAGAALVLVCWGMGVGLMVWWWG